MEFKTASPGDLEKLNHINPTPSPTPYPTTRTDMNGDGVPDRFETHPTPHLTGGFGAGGNNETLSMKQAEKIVEELNKIMTLCKTKIEQKDTEFINKLSKVWEDKNATEFIQKHKKSMDSLMEGLNKNDNIFVNAVRDITAAYAKAGGMALSLAAQAVHLGIVLPIEIIKEFFGDGNGDDFGFKDPDKGADQVLDAFEELSTAIEKTASDAVNQIRSINAFGNTRVQLNLASSAGEIVNIVKTNIQENKKMIKEYVDQTAAGYKSVGSNAEGAAKISSN